MKVICTHAGTLPQCTFCDAAEPHDFSPDCTGGIPEGEGCKGQPRATCRKVAQ